MADTTALTAGAAAVLMLAIGAAATGIVGPSRSDLGAGLTVAQAAPQENARDFPARDPAVAPALPPQPAERSTLAGRTPELQIDANRNSPLPRPTESVPLAQPQPGVVAQPRPVIEPDPATKNPPTKPMPLPTPVAPSTTRDPGTAPPTTRPPSTSPTVVRPTSSATATATATRTGRPATP